ncbi:hypothetical protein HSB1_41500 [Halogranum salarium B-1]|uniref:Uncharacterized protein n=1 Tax=Halogranum salarium B-1 TaxID=1210908 RepID=J3ETI2_9EURY|nr:hypothetical protein HSB1_41500 [Halogranum salarium B-1]
MSAIKTLKNALCESQEFDEVSFSMCLWKRCMASSGGLPLSGYAERT